MGRVFSAGRADLGEGGPAGRRGSQEYAPAVQGVRAVRRPVPAGGRHVRHHPPDHPARHRLRPQAALLHHAVSV